MKALPVLLGAVIGLALQACVSTPSSSVPSVLVSSEYGRGESGKNTATHPLQVGITSGVAPKNELGWWREFGDERLNRLVITALRSNIDLASAGMRLQQARLLVGLSYDELIPGVDASASLSHSKPLSGADRTGLRGSSASAGVAYELDLWRRLRGQRDLARWEAEATAEDLQSIELALVGETCRLYWTLAFLNQRIAAGEASLTAAQKTQQLVQSQFTAGAVSRLERREVEQSLQSQLAAQSQLIQSRVETRNALLVLLGGNPWPEAEEPQDLRAASVPAIREGLPAELLSRRPDIRAAELRLRSTLTDIDVTRVSYYPTISLTGSVSSGGRSLQDVLSNPVGTLGAGLALPFLRYNQMRLNVALAHRDYEIAANDFRNTLYEAFTEVDNALSADAELAKQVAASQKSFDEALEIERLYGARYRSGAASLRIWLDAQERRRAAELSLAQVRFEQLQNSSVLFRALGGGIS